MPTAISLNQKTSHSPIHKSRIQGKQKEKEKNELVNISIQEKDHFVSLATALLFPFPV